MPHFGAPWGTHWGPNEHAFLWWEFGQAGLNERARFQMRSGYEQYVRFVISGVSQGPPEYVQSGVVKTMYGLRPDDEDDVLYALVPQGPWASPLIDPAYQLIFYQEDRADRFIAQITAAPSWFAHDYSDATYSGQLTNWVISGAKRFNNVMSDPLNPRWGRLKVAVTDAGGDYTVDLYKDDIKVATGTRTGNGTVTLSASNNSGLSGSVDIAYSTDVAVTDNCYLVGRWAKQYKIHYRTSAFTAPDFPRTAEVTLTDDGYSNVVTWRSPILANGTYYVVIHQVDENDNESTGLFSGGTTITIAIPPEPAGEPEYVSGGYAATVIQWAASATGGATYNIYDSLDTELIDLITPQDTEGAGTGTIQKTLAAIDSAFTGWRYVVVRSVSGGIENGKTYFLRLEYANGVFVEGRPPRPGFGRVTISGRQLSVPVVVDRDEETGTPAQIKLTIENVATGVTQSTTVAISAADARNIVFQTVQITASGDGNYTYSAITLTSGGIESDSSDTYGPVRLSTTVPSDPTFTTRKGT